MAFRGVTGNAPKDLNIKEKYETLVPYKSEREIFNSLESLNPGDTLEHWQWQDIIMACRIIAKKNRWFGDKSRFTDDKHIKAEGDTPYNSVRKMPKGRKCE
jgi:hypothetical protein